jgi:LysM repeat protein
MPYKIFLELNNRRLFLKKDSLTINTYPVAIGKPSTPTPEGDFKILSKIMNPGGVLGTRWMQFTWSEHGIHGTNQPWLIGQAVSNGCVRMHNSNVEQVYSRVSIGTAVIIRNSFNNPGQPLNPKDPINKNKSTFIYTVKKGDSLWKISRRYNISISEIKSINKLDNNTIYPGQKLRIPTRN